jgi:hypothetical protein
MPRRSNKRDHTTPAWLLRSGFWSPERGSGQYVLKSNIDHWREMQPPPKQDPKLRVV